MRPLFFVGEGPEKAYITLWMRADDLGDITLGTTPARTSETAKGRTLDSTLRILEALGVEIRQVVLHLADGRTCLAAVELLRIKGDAHNFDDVMLLLLLKKEIEFYLWK